MRQCQTATFVLDSRTDGQGLADILKEVQGLEDPDCDTPSVCLWAVGPGGDAHPEDLAEELVLTLQSLHQPVIGVAMGKLSSRSSYIISACDYVYSDGISELSANVVLNSSDMKLACQATVETIESMTPGQRDLLKNEMLQVKVQQMNAIKETSAMHEMRLQEETLQSKRAKHYDRTGSLGSACSTEAPDMQDDGQPETDEEEGVAVVRKVRFSSMVEVYQVEDLW